MGFWKSTLIFVSAVVLFGALFSANMFLTLHWSLNYENVESTAQNLTDKLLEDLGEKGILLQEYSNKKFLCYGNENMTFSFNDEEIAVPCEIIENGGKEFLEYFISKITYNLYYKNYDCEFLDCIKTQEQPLVLISEKARIYWGDKFYVALLVAFVAFVVLFFLNTKKSVAFLVGGGMIIISALPFKDVTKLFSLLPEFLPFDVLPVFFSDSYGVYVIMLIAGIVFLAVGLVIGFFKYGVKIKNFLNKRKGKTSEEAKV